jgi:phage-related protein
MKIKSWFKGFGGLLGGFDNLFDALKSTSSEILKPVSKVGKETEKAVKTAGKTVEKAAEVTGKQVVKGTTKAVDKAVEVGKNLADSSVGAIKSAIKGDIMGVLKNAGNIASYGTVDLTGKNRGLLNVNTDKYIAKIIGAKDMGASGTGSIEEVSNISQSKQKRTGLLSQLRTGRGNAGGGSYTEIAKYPLGGSSCKTGK